MKMQIHFLCLWNSRNKNSYNLCWLILWKCTNHAKYGCVLLSSLSCYKSVERVFMLWCLKSSETCVTLCLCHTCASHQEPDAELTEQPLVMLVVLFVVKLQVVQGMMGWRQTHLTAAVQLKLPQLSVDFGLFQQTVNIHQITVIYAYLYINKYLRHSLKQSENVS